MTESPILPELGPSFIIYLLLVGAECAFVYYALPWMAQRLIPGYTKAREKASGIYFLRAAALMGGTFALFAVIGVLLQAGAFVVGNVLIGCVAVGSVLIRGYSRKRRGILDDLE